MEGQAILDWVSGTPDNYFELVKNPHWMLAPHLNVSDDVGVELAVELVGNVLGRRDVTKQILSPRGEGGGGGGE